MTQYASAPSQHTEHHAQSYAAPDYGPFGKMPVTSEVVFFGETWGARKGPTVFIVLGAILTLFGLLSLPGGVTFAAGALLIVGLSFVGIGVYNRKNQIHLDIVCDIRGITVRRSNRKEGALPSIWIPWNTVSAIRCTVQQVDTQSTEGGKTSTFVQGFAIDADGQPAFKTDEKMTKKLPAFIDLCNSSAPHLGYRWIPKKSAHGLPVIESVYKYAKVPLS